MHLMNSTLPLLQVDEVVFCSQSSWPVSIPECLEATATASVVKRHRKGVENFDRKHAAQQNQVTNSLPANRTS